MLIECLTNYCTGYVNRSKEVDTLIIEIRENIKKIQTFHFNFLDNDIINNNYDRFNYLLTKLINLKREYPEFKIGMAEIITKGINADVIKRMSLASFEHVQIGYESTSNNILKKNENKMEAIGNLHFLRFFLKYGQFNHSQTTLGVSGASRYYKKVDIKSGEWKQHAMFDQFFPKKYLSIDDELDIIEACHTNMNTLWNDFMQVEKYYLMGSYTYKLIGYKSSIIYKEYFNGISINEIEFEVDSLDWLILCTANAKVVSLEELLSLAKATIDSAMMDIEVINAVEDLKTEGLLYASDNCNEIISIINIDTLT